MNVSSARSISSNALLGMSFALASITMVFVGLTSAYVARRGLDPQWASVSAPPAALSGGAFLVASSLALEFGRRRSDRKWLVASWALALAFIATQIAACMELAAAGLYLSTSAHASFFYLFTVLHGLHVCGGMAALMWAIGTRAAGTRLTVIALYWHVMAILWIYLLAVLFAWS